MPRRNSNTLTTERKPRATHVLVHRFTGRIYASGTKREMLERAELNNAVEAAWTWTTQPIHK